MSRWKVVCIVLILGMGIGAIAPAAVSRLQDIGSTLNVTKIEPALAKETLTSTPKTNYHFEIKQGMLSVVEGSLGSDGKVIVSGYNVQSWPKGILDMAAKVEFNSVDEVQSFFDTINEPLWQ